MKNKQIKSNYKDIIFNVYYAVVIIVLGIIGLFSNSYFAYKIFNSNFVSILNLILIISIFIVRLIQIYPKQKMPFGKAFTICFYLTISIVLALRPFLNNRIWLCILLINFIASIILLLILLVKSWKYKNKYFFSLFETIVTALPLFTMIFFTFKLTFINSAALWITSLIVCVFISIPAIIFYIKNYKNIEYYKKNNKGEFYATIIIILIICYLFTESTLCVINYSFNDNYTTLNVPILEKRVDSGAKRGTSFYFTVNIKGKEIEIDVPVEVYHSKNVGSNIGINQYKGALGYNYLIYENNSNSTNSK